jgi:hypothetical protein
METEKDEFELEMEERRKQEPPTSRDNPAPFKQPFLVISFKDQKIHGNVADGWHVEVDGQIQKYFEGFTERTLEWAPPFNSMHRATPLLKSIVEYFASRGMEVASVATYAGSAGPSHILRNGKFFQRMKF